MLTLAIAVVEKNRAEEKVRWDWKLMFKKIAHDIARCIDQEMRNLLTSVLENESQDWGKMGKLVMSPVPEQLWGGKQDYPKCVSKVTDIFIFIILFSLSVYVIVYK